MAIGYLLPFVDHRLPLRGYRSSKSPRKPLLPPPSSPSLAPRSSPARFCCPGMEVEVHVDGLQKFAFQPPPRYAQCLNTSNSLEPQQRVLSKRGGDVGEGGPQRRRIASRRHGELRVEARARERCRRPSRRRKAAGRSGDDGDTEAEGGGEDEGSSRFCPPRGDDSLAHTRPTRAASQSGAARGGELEGNPAEGWPTSPTQCRRRPPRPPETTTTTPSSQPASSLLGLLQREREREREEGSEEAKNMRVYCHVTCATE
uniref:Uncharacterized protein n=1 Tax=Oryza nivara TaxID=4536 RepID=A0A0E0FV70_ORYNI